MTDDCDYCGTLIDGSVDGNTCDGCIGLKRYCQTCWTTGWVADGTDSATWMCDRCTERAKPQPCCYRCSPDGRTDEEWLDLGYPECDYCKQEAEEYKKQREKRKKDTTCLGCGEYDCYILLAGICLPCVKKSS